ncbi:fibronectin isoform X2 [Planococcus citri]|uniref:fibronectin isoform X2 n=1 Tax=Planococcus citri TaxID=170843 RepID=UPI0031F74767
MLLYAAGLIFQISLLQSLGSGANVTGPENITITFLNVSSVQISWSVDLKQIERYDIMYKPTEANYRVVAVVAANSNSVTLNNLLSNTQYQMSVTAIRDGKKYRSRPIVFRTLESGAVVTDLITNTDNETASGNVITLRTPDIIAGTGNTISPSAPVPPPPPYGPSNPQQAYIQVRGIEVTIVILVLMVWVGAIILFFNRWGKIRMLIPYQPDYKETQLKVPGTGACSSSNTCQNQNGSGLCCSQGGCCILDHCFKYNTASSTPTPSTPEVHPRDCNCRFALLHRAPVSD